ncbi:ASCH domain-containing protein [Paenibacillus sanfengchensis]|uniref:ASCH domain-containing protein n=1 Tax=Paenibacillus sanfengchensis TaxID=3119819 RepID=UPI003A5C50DA
MRCITIRQPWATLIAIGEKRLETRGWKTNYRGELAIHAGKRVDRAACLAEPVRSLLAASGYSAANLPTGAVVAVGRLAGCYPVMANDGETAVLDVGEGGGLGAGGGSGNVGELGKAGQGGKERGAGGEGGDRALVVAGQEYRFGDFALGRYGWELAEVRKLPEPVPAAGKQGLWNWEARW